MSRLSDLVARIRSLVLAAREDRELTEEIRFHIDKEVEKNLAAGLSPREARRQAHIKFGGVERMRERAREARGVVVLEGLIRDARLAVRSLARRPLLAVTVVGTLALGIGANSAVFSAIDAVLLSPLPYPDSDRLVRLHEIGANGAERSLALPRLEDWRRMNRSFTGITGYYVDDVAELSGELPERLGRARVGPGFLDVLRVEPSVGRDFVAEELRYGGPAAALISNPLWHRRFAADPNVIGRTLMLGGASATVVGVMPASFEFPSTDVDVWVPLPPDTPTLQSRTLRTMQTVGRLAPAVTLEEAREDLTRVQNQLAQLLPETDSELRVSVQSLKGITVAEARTSLWLLYGAVSVLLLIACANIAAILLSRAAQRGPEVAVRLSLGASRRSIVSQHLMEALVLALAGGAAGLALANGATEAATRLAIELPRFGEIQADGRIILYTLTCSVAVTLLCGLLPAMRASQRDTRASLAGGSRWQVGGGQRLQWTLVGSQVALAVALLSGAALLLRSVQEVGRIAPGFDADGVLAMNVSTAWSETNDMPAFTRWSNEILEAIESVPGVEAAAVASGLPGLRSGSSSEWVHVGGPREPASSIVADFRFVSPDYFDVLRIPLLAGQRCRQGDDPGRVTAEVMVNERFADAYFDGRPVVGTRLRSAAGDGSDPGVEIVGVVGDAREAALEREPTPTIYGCDAVAYPGYYLLARVERETAAVTNALRRRVQQFDPGRALFGLMPLDGYLSGSFAEDRVRTALVTFFALTAVLLAALGLYGTLARHVGTRRREIGLRMALGADPDRVVRELLQQGMRVAVIGALAGIGLALASGRILRGMLYGVSPSDPLALSGVIVVVLAATALASLVPSVRASHVDPTRALQDE